MATRETIVTKLDIVIDLNDGDLTERLFKAMDAVLDEHHGEALVAKAARAKAALKASAPKAGGGGASPAKEPKEKTDNEVANEAYQALLREHAPRKPDGKKFNSSESSKVSGHLKTLGYNKDKHPSDETIKAAWATMVRASRLAPRVRARAPPQAPPPTVPHHARDAQRLHADVRARGRHGAGGRQPRQGARARARLFTRLRSARGSQ